MPKVIVSVNGQTVTDLELESLNELNEALGEAQERAMEEMFPSTKWDWDNADVLHAEFHIQVHEKAQTPA